MGQLRPIVFGLIFLRGSFSEPIAIDLQLLALATPMTIPNDGKLSKIQKSDT